MKKTLLSCALFAVAFLSKGQLTITNNPSASQIATLLEGTGVTVSSLTVNCSGLSIGEFSGTSEMSITHGLVLSSGIVDSLAGGNYSPATTGYVGTPGDADLDFLSSSTTYDGCVLEFDCQPVGDTLLFNYCFGSEEYPEYVGFFNDIFAILISGPGITGTINAATLPGGIPVSINNVNDTTNSSFYYNNAAGVYTSMDGFTTNLTAFAEVIPGSTYHFKVAVADANDQALDSGVFLEAFSFRSMADATGVKEENDFTLSVYPNPSNGIFYINDKESKLQNGQLRIVNVLGEVVFSEVISSTQAQINLSNQASGLYVASIQTENGIYKTRLIKK